MHATSSPLPESLAPSASRQYAADPALNGGRHEIVFIVDNIADWETLAGNTKPGVEVVVLDSRGDGLQQMANYLAGRSGIDVMHLISHGAAGQLDLGTLTLDAVTGQTRADDLAALGQALTEVGDLLLYGCSVGDASGQEFITAMALLSGADVAASSDFTGATASGGDWDLEVLAGSIEADIALSAYGQQYFEGVLATFTGTAGNDTLVGSAEDDILDGLAGNDQISAQAGADTLYGGLGDDSIAGFAGDDEIYGGDGNDLILALDDNDFVYGEAGNDTVSTGTGNDTVYGGNDGDVIRDNDTSSKPGSDLLYGDAGADNILGAYGSDTLDGGDGNDTLNGGQDNDILYGDAGTDVLSGSTGNDTLYGGGDSDTLVGGTGNDVFQGSVDDFDGDTISDFAIGDSIIVTGTDLSALNGTTASGSITLDTGKTLTLTGISAASGVFVATFAAGNTTITLTSVVLPTVSSASYDASTGTLVVTCSNLAAASGSSNDVDASKLTLTGEGGATYTLTDTSDVEIDSATQFTLTLSATDKAAVNQIFNKMGTASTGGTTFNLATADDWNTGVTTGDSSDTTGNGITVSNVAAPTITSATYDATTGALVVTGSGFVRKSGANNDIDLSMLTFTGQGGATYTLTTASDVEVTSATAFSATLSGADKTGVDALLNKNGTASAGGTTYNLAAGEDWSGGSDSTVTVADTTGNGITVSGVAPATVTLSVNNAALAEAAGTTTVTATLSASASTDTTVTLSASGTAAGSGTDYTLSSNTITITAGQTTGTATITAVQDSLDENDETVIVDISAVSGGDGATESGTQQQTVSLTDDDAAPSLSIADISQAESNSSTSTMTFTVTLSAASGKPVSVDYATGNGTATAGSDYSAASGTLNFAADETSKTFNVTIAGDTATESDETFTVTLSNASNATISVSTATGTIQNDDNAAPAFTSLNGGATFTEGGSAVVVDSDVTVADTELDALNANNGNYNGASITLARNGGANSQDVFGNGGLLGTLTEGQSFTYNNVTVGTVTTNSAGTFKLTFNASATSAIVDAVLQAVTYSNSSDAPPASVALDWNFNDGTTNSSGTNQAIVNITGVNDAPTDIALSNSNTSIYDGANAAVGTLSSTDADVGDTHTYSLVSGSGDTNNTSFSIAGSTLSTVGALANGTYTVRIRSTDNGSLSYEKTFSVSVSDTLIVTTSADSGADTTTGSAYAAELADGSGLSFREAVALVAGIGGGNIGFGTGTGSITLESLVTIPQNIALDADSIGTLTLAASGSGSISIDTGKTLSLGNGSGDIATISAGIAGSGALEKTGDGKLILLGSNSYSGTTKVTGGTLLVAADSKLGTGTVNLDGGTLNLNGFGGGTVDNAITLGASGGTINVTTSSAKLSGNITGTGNLAKTGGQNLTLSGTNSYSGTTTIANTLIIGGDVNIGAGAITLNAGATLQVTGGGTIDNAVTLNGDGTVQTDAATILSGAISGSGALTKTGGSALTLSSDSTYTGTTNLSTGVLIVTHSNALGTAAGGTTVASGTTLRLGNGVTIADALTLSGIGVNAAYGALKINEGTGSATVAGNITLAANASIGAYNAGDLLTLSGTINGGFALTKVGSGTLVLSGSNTYGGATTVSTGTLSLSGGASIADTSAVTVASGAILSLVLGNESIGSLAGAGNVVLGYRLTAGGDNTTTTFSGVISGSGNGLIKTGSGTLTLTGNNSYTGATLVSAGGLTLNRSGGALADSSAVTVDAGATLTLSQADTIGSLAGAGAVVLGSNPLTVGGGNSSTTFSGILSGTNGSLSKAGSGTFTLTGTNTYTGTTTVSAGTLAGTGSLAGALNLDGRNGITATLAPGVSGAGIFTLGGGLTHAEGGILAMDIHGATAGTNYDQIAVTGAVDLTDVFGTGATTLTLDFGSFTPTIGDSFTLIDNDATDAITGTVKLNGTTELADNATFTAAGKTFRIDYDGGTGNDLVLSVINNAPVLNAAATPAFTALPESVPDASNSGRTVAALVVDGSITDVDGAAAEAIAVSAADNAHGTWQYKIGAGVWTAFNFTTNAGKALLLAPTDTVRFVPNAGWSGSTNLTFYAWDQSSGSAGNYLTVSGNTGGSGPLSALNDTAGVTVNAAPSDPAPTVKDDGDKIPATTEEKVPTLPPTSGGTAVAGDGNGDGVADSAQANVTSVPFLKTDTAESAPGDAPPIYVTLVSDSVAGKADTTQTQTAVLKDIQQLDAPADKPADVDMPLGLISFTADVASAGAQEDFSLYVGGGVLINGYWKQNTTGTWVNLASTDYGGRVVSEGGKTRLDFQIVDGGEFDDDGKADGVITDPGAPGWRTVAGSDADNDQFPDGLEASHGLTVGSKDNDVFASTKFFVLQLYRDFLFREAEVDGLNYWMEQIDAGQRTRTEVASLFLDSTEFQAGAGPLARLYLGAFGRLPDAAGMDYWMAARQDGMSLADIAAGFAGSAEFQGRYGALDDAALVAQLYQNLLERAPEASGAAYWQAQRTAGLSTGDLVLGFTESAEYVARSDRDVTVTLDYVGLLARTPEQGGFDYWLDRLDHGMPEIAVIGAFMETAEYHDRFLP